MQYNENNVFYQIIKNTNKKAILETAHTIAIHDIYPRDKIHILLIPKGKYISMYDFYKTASAIERDDFHSAYLQIIKQFNIATNHTTETNNGRNQLVYHAHMHIISSYNIS